MLRYARLLSWVAGSAWAIEPVKAQIILDVLMSRVTGAVRADDTPWDDDDAEDRAVRRQAAARARNEPQEGIAIVPLTGVISPRVHDVEGISTGGGVSAEGFAALMRQLAAESAVKGAVVDVDSPGGNVAGVPEAVEAIRDVRAAGKPVSAVAHHWAASAAYWLASAADELVVTPSGEVGSIGVYVYHEDISKRLALLGVTPTLIKAGPNKAEGHPAFPLGEDATAHLQARVDDYYNMFVKDVAKGRKVPVGTVREQFGGGRMVGAQEAVRLGMADRVGSLADTIKRMQRTTAKAGRTASASVAVRRRRLAVA
jgi:signal peptide peptidase SppA